MRRQIDWMSQPADDRILELLRDADLELTPAVIAHNLDYSRQHVTKRIKNLRAHSFIERTDDSGYYRITTKGTDYLDGNLDPD